MRAPACLILAALLSPSVAYPQVPSLPRDAAAQKTGTARLSGQVRSAETGKPLRRALVRATSPEFREGRTATTDADGRWTIKSLPAGRYTVSVSKGGFVTLVYGQRRPFEQGKPLDVGDAQAIDKLDVDLPKGGVITGRINDEFGEPFSGIRVTPMRYRYLNGQRRLVTAAAGDITDDVGQYRLHGLSPGDYYVSATNAMVAIDVSDDRMGYAPTYHPGTPMVGEAQRVTVVEGQETPNISFDLAPTRVANISGTAVNSLGKPIAGAMILLTSPLLQGGLPVVNPSVVRPDGSFTISNVTPGEYRLETYSVSDLQLIGTGNTSSMTFAEAASVPIVVTGQDQMDVRVVAMPASTGTGRIVLEGEPQPKLAPASVTVTAIAPALTSLLPGGLGRVRDDWTFEARGLTGKRYFRATAPAGWYLKSVSLNGVDVTDTGVECVPGEDLSGVEIMLTRRMPSLAGGVLTSEGKAVRDYTVVVFPDDPRRWAAPTRFIRLGRPDQTGNFLVRGLVPEDYLVAAVEYLEPGEEGDPALLEQLRSRATRVMIREGEAKMVTLTLNR